MKYLFWVLLMGFTACTHPGVEKYRYSDSELPEECRLVELPENRVYPYGIPRNPFITDSLDFLNLFSYQLMGDTMLAPFAKEGLFSLFTGLAENGINAIRYDTPETAAQALIQINNIFPDTARFQVIQDGCMIVHLWTDDPQDPCYSALRRKVGKQE